MDNLFNMLAMMHCVAQSEMFSKELKKRNDGYTPKTNIWELLTIAETHGVEPVASIVATVLTGVKFNKIDDPVVALYDLVVALTYKTKFYDVHDKESNDSVRLLGTAYNHALDVVSDSLNDESLPSDVTEAVSNLLIGD